METGETKVDNQPTLPDLAACLRSCREEVLQAWLREARKRVPYAAGHTELAIYNSLPEFLDQLASVLDRDLKPEIACRKACVAHSEDRTLMESFTLEQVILEYQILRQTLFAVLESKVGALAGRAREVLIETVDQAVRMMATLFSEKKLITALALLEAAELKALDSKAESARTHAGLSKLYEEKGLRSLFVSAIAHDLRNPVSVIRMSAEFIEEEYDDPDEVKAHAARIIGKTGQLLSMIQDLMDSELLRAGADANIFIKKEEVDLAPLVKAVWEEQKTLYGDRFVLELPDSDRQDLRGTWDYARIRRVIENLLSNAVKHGDPRAPVILKASANGEAVTIQVHNEGEPIAREEQQNLFRPFYRSKRARDSVKGWGIGLSFIQGVAKAHGGRAMVDSRPGEGTTFTVELPKHSS